MLSRSTGSGAGGAQPGKKDQSEDLAGKSTLNRLELSTGKTSRYKKIHYWRDAIDELLLELFVESFAVAPTEIVLDLDATDLPLHGGQEALLSLLLRTLLLPAVVYH